METTYQAPNRGARTGENLVPEALKKLGRLTVWAVSGSQFVDLIWRDCDDPSDNDGRSTSARGERLSQAELTDLMRRATRERSSGVPSR